MEQLDDSLEQSPHVQKKKEEGWEEEWKIGFEEGLVEALQRAFVIVVQGRFPPLAGLAQKRVSLVTKYDKLDLLLVQIIDAPDEPTARWLISTLAA
ncbi:MAG TPA: hypothetical protein VJO32_01130 [Ktedonobacteraceae bacterium]|nr:hypothetical protein [Ktedonobacteraceae bacterium]